MAKRTYPTLPDGLETKLKAVAMLMESDPGFLDAPECPYPPGLREILRKLGSKSEKMAVSSLFSEDDDPSDRFGTVLEEIERTMSEFRMIENDLGNAEPKERIDYFKAKTALMERWIGQKEKIFTMREISEFQKIILGVIDEFLDKDQKQDLKKRLASLESLQ